MGAVGNNKQDLFVMIELMIQVFIEVRITYLSQHNQLPAVLLVCVCARVRVCVCVCVRVCASVFARVSCYFACIGNR